MTNSGSASRARNRNSVAVAWVAGIITVVIPCVVLAQQPDAPQDEASSPGRFQLAPVTYVQFDFRAFPDWDVVPGTGSLNRPTAEARRIRLGIDGRWKRVSFELSVDPNDDDGVFAKDAYLQLNVNRAVRVRVGQFKLPGSRDYAVSARRLDFIERAPLSSIAVRRDLGGMMNGRIGRVGYQAGIFAGDGVGRDDRAELTAAGRVTWQAARGLEVGGSVSDARTRAHDEDPANGPDGRAPSGYRFYEGVYVQGQRLRLGTDVTWTPGRWRFVAEALRARDERLEQGIDHDDLPAVVGIGFSASALRRFGSGQPNPGNLFSQILRRPVQAALRYDYLSFDDVATPTGRDSVRSRASDVRAKAAHAITLGGTWSINNWVRLMGDAGLERYSEPRSAPETGRRGNYLTLATRLQFEWSR